MLGPAAPDLAARVAERLFFRAQRRPRPAWEHEVLERGERFLVPWQEGQLPAWAFGRGPTILLVHGWEGRGAQLGGFVQPLVEAGFRVVLFDAPGHGDSTAERASLVDFADAIERVASVVGPLHGIVAHSMGGLATTIAMSRRPTAPRLVFIAPPTDPRKFTRAFADALGMDEALRFRMVERVESRFGTRIDDLVATNLVGARREPLLVIHDEDDREVGLADAEALASTWPGAHLVTTRGLGHRRVLKDAAVIRYATRFLNGYAPATPGRECIAPAFAPMEPADQLRFLSVA